MVRRNLPDDIAVLEAGKCSRNTEGDHSAVPDAPALYRFLYVFTVWISIAMSCSMQASGQQDISTVNYGSKPVTLADALRSTVAYHPALKKQHWEIEAGRAARKQASARFDTLVQSGVSQKKVETPLTSSQQQQFSTTSPISATNLTSYNANVSKLFRNGVGFTSSVNVGRSTDNLLNQLGVSTSDAGVQLIVPLLSGRGKNVVSAPETAAEIEVGSREFDLQQTAEQLLTNTAVSYWVLVAAKRHVQVSLGSEDRGRVLQKTVQALIDADQVPRNDIYEVNANLADRVATRIAAQQALVQARERLAVDMGIPPAAVLGIGDPADDFPALDNTINMATDDSLKEYIDEALHNRPDLVAAQRREAQARLLFGASEKQIQPQLNLQLGAGYSQLREAGGLTDFFAAPFSNLHRPSLQAGLVYQYSVANNLAQGQLLAAQASYREAQLQTADLERQITATVIIAVENVRNSISRVQSAREAVSAFQQTLRGQQEKFNLGQVSLTELLTVEDRLTTALSNEVDAELSYVLAVADLRLATATLLPATNAGQVDASVFRSVPRVQHLP